MSKTLPLFAENLSRLGLFISRERTLILAIFTYAIAVSAFSLIIPLTVQELVNSFAFTVSPVMLATLIGIMAMILLLVGIFRVLQFYATDILERRVFVHTALNLGRKLPQFKKESFRSDSISWFLETVFMQRALSNLFVDLINVLVGGLIGMTLLALYHPYFLFFDLVLLGSVLLIVLLGRGGLHRTIEMSQTKYDTFHWFQEVADNLLHFKATNSSNLILKETDALALAYVKTRRSRFRVLCRQYIGSLILQVLLHTGLLGTAGWLLSNGELTLGQLVAAEVIVTGLLLNMDSVVKRAYVVFYFFTSLAELDHLFSLPQDRTPKETMLSIPSSGETGLHLTCSRLSWSDAASSMSWEVNVEALPSEKWAIICPTESMRYRVSLVLAGLDPAPAGIVRYNGVDVRNLTTDELNSQRGIVFSWDLTLFQGTVTDNVTMDRPGIGPKDLLWALKTVQLDTELEEFADGLYTTVEDGGREFTPSQRLRILLARTIITRPRLLILDGALREIQPSIREAILGRLCAPEAPWTLVILTTDPLIETYVQRLVTLREGIHGLPDPGTGNTP